METIRYFLGTDEDVLFCPLSKVLGLEAAVVNAFSPGDTVIIPVFGETGECWAQVAEAFGLLVIRLGGYGGGVPTPEDLRLLLWTREKGEIRGVLVPHVERTTGLWVDLAGFGEVCRFFGVLCVAEVGESFGVFPLELDRTGVDLAVVTEPLLFQNVVLFVAGRRAWEAWEHARCPRFGLDFSRIRGRKENPPLSFLERLEALQALGKEALWERRKYLAELFRKKLQVLGVTVSQGDLFPSVSVVEFAEKTQRENVLSALWEQKIAAGRVPQRENALWVRHGDTLEESEIYGLLEVFEKFSTLKAEVNEK